MHLEQKKPRLKKRVCCLVTAKILHVELTNWHYVIEPIGFISSLNCIGQPRAE